MRKVDPSDVCDEFRDEIAALRQFSERMSALGPTKTERSRLVELTFHSAYVNAESFLSRWIIGAINRDSSAYTAFRANSIRESVKSKYSAWDSSKTTYAPPAHIPVADLERLLDPEGWNLTFKDFATFREKCNSWLTAPYLAKINSVPQAVRHALDAAKAIRNCIAHRSKNSFDEMNTRLTGMPVGGVLYHLRTKVNAVTNVGSHLKTVVGGKARWEHYFDQFNLLQAKLR